jgi:hypothetical protein
MGMNRTLLRWRALWTALTAALLLPAAQAASLKTRNVFLIVSDPRVSGRHPSARFRS